MYTKSTQGFGILYCNDYKPKFLRYVDLDWISDINQIFSIIGLVFIIRTSLILWLSKKYPTMTLSTSKTKYKALENASREALWLIMFLQDLYLNIK